MTIIKNKLISGVFYTAIARYSNVFIAIFIGAILARLLSPEEFGIVALVLVFITFFSLLSNFGLGPAVVQNQTLSEDDIKSIFSFSIVLSLVLSSMFFLLAPLIAWFYNDIVLVNISRLLAISIFFFSVQIVPKAILQKELKFKKIAKILIFVQIMSGAIAIVLAYNGYSYYSLVIKSILDSSFTFVLFYWASPVKATKKIKKKAVKKIVRFSTFQFLFNFVNYFSRNIDNLLIGKYMGAASLGFYDKSYRLMLMPVQNLTHVITPVLLPILSKYKEDKNRVYDSYIPVVKFLALLGFPLSVFLFFSASEIIILVYGSQWGESIPVFKLLGLTVGIQIVLSSSGSIFQALNRTDLLFKSGLINSFFMVGGICYGLFIKESLEAIGLGIVIAFILNFFQGFYFLIVKALDKSFVNFLSVFSIPLVITLITFVLFYFCSMININNVLLSFIIKCGLFGLIISTIILINRKEVLQIVKKR